MPPRRSLLFPVLLLLCCPALKGRGQALRPDPAIMSRLISDSVIQLDRGLREIHLSYLNKAGRPMAVYILEARLGRGLALEATTPFNKDTFCRQTVMEQMRWEDRKGHRVLAGVNADFFDLRSGVPQQMVYKEGRALRDTVRPQRGFAGVLRSGRLTVGDAARYAAVKDKLDEALGGYQLLLDRGRVIPQPVTTFDTTRHPRTALGIRGRRRLFLVVVDGRQPAYANGMPLEELAQLCKDLGARQAINLDGGGSTTLVSRDPASGRWQVRNRPSDGRERKVANAWIIVSRRPRPAADSEVHP